MRTFTGTRSVSLVAGALALGSLATLGSIPVGSASAAGHSGTHATPSAHSEVLAPGVQTAVRMRVTYRSRYAFPIWSRSTINSAYWRMYAASEPVPTGFTGNVDSCNAGSSSAASHRATRLAINFVRRLGGLSPIQLGSRLNYRSQKTSLLMSANGALSHNPPSSWRCWNRTAASNAARSDLALAYPNITSGGVVSLYMDDRGDSNVAVGHRRWLMNPFATWMGSGSTDTANAITVVGPTSPYRPNPSYVSWPTRGYFPNTLEPEGRWSLSAGDRRTQFGRATVRVYQMVSGAIPVQLSVHKLPIENGYAQPTIAWDMPETIDKTARYKVVVTGIRKAGSTRTYSKSYYTNLFTPTR